MHSSTRTYLFYEECRPCDQHLFSYSKSKLQSLYSSLRYPSQSLRLFKRPSGQLSRSIVPTELHEAQPLHFTLPSALHHQNNNVLHIVTSMSDSRRGFGFEIASIDHFN
jgi:hypothetical protein